MELRGEPSPRAGRPAPAPHHAITALTQGLGASPTVMSLAGAVSAAVHTVQTAQTAQKHSATPGNMNI